MACAVPSSKPVIFFKGILIPIASKNCLIDSAATWGRAVNTNISLLPNLPCLFLAKSASGPSAVSKETFSKLLKSNVAPASVKIPACLANSLADISVTVPSTLVTIIFSFVLA